MSDKKGNRQFGLCLNIYLKLFPLRTPSQGKSRVWKEEDTGHCSAPSSHVLSRRLDVSQQSCPVMVWHFVLPCDKMLTCWRCFRNNPEQRRSAERRDCEQRVRMSNYQFFFLFKAVFLYIKFRRENKWGRWCLSELLIRKACLDDDTQGDSGRI